MKPSNIDTGQIAWYEELSGKWWDPQGEMKPLHDINPLRLGYIDSRVGLAGKQVLDVGCGGGLLAESMATLGAVVTAIDAAPAALAAAKRHMHTSGLRIDYRQATPEELAVHEPRRYDVVTCLELLEHVPDPASVVNACARLLKPGGDLVVATLNRTLKAFVFAIVGGEYLLRLLPRGTHTYRRFIKPQELMLWSRRCGLIHRHTIGLHYNPFTRVYRLGPGAMVNYMMHLQKPDAANRSGYQQSPKAKDHE